nr:integrase, catalytic region, zinc finger, CCHC-type, peptidase aspartic, catalytic [Tanacetum cinerariifolium]
MTLVKQSQELKTVSYHKLYDILKQHQNEVNEIRAKRIARVVNPLALVAQQQPVYNPQNHPTRYTQNSSTRSQQAATRNRGKSIVNSPQPIYDQEPSMVTEDDETSKDKEIDKLMALISLSFKKIYKPTNNNFQTSSNTNQELEAHYMYMAQLQEVSPNTADSGPIFDTEPVQKVSTDDHYNVFAIESEIEDFKNKNESLESSNNHFIEANNKLSKTNNLLYNDFKKSQAELARRNDVDYASKVEIDCAKARGDLISYKIESQKSFNKYTQTINDLNHTISEMKEKLYAHQETISIMSQQKEAQIKLYKTREDNELESNQKPRNITRKLYERVRKACSWCYPKFTPSGYKWKPISEKENVNPNVSMPLGSLVEIVLFIVDSRCSKHMTGNLKLLINYVEKFLGTVKFGNDQIVPILGYGDLVQGAVTIKWVYYVEGLNHN